MDVRRCASVSVCQSLPEFLGHSGTYEVSSEAYPFSGVNPHHYPNRCTRAYACARRDTAQPAGCARRLGRRGINHDK